MWPKFKLRLIRRGQVFISKLINTHTSISDELSENICEDDYSGSNNDFLGFDDE
jgi:hypothetical protein